MIVWVMLFVLQVCNAQNTVKYGSYKMDNTNKNYSIFINYNNDKNINKILINVESTDPIFKESSFVLDKIGLLKFNAYLAFLYSKQAEWDLINISNKTKDVVKKIEWDEEITVDCSYTDGPIKIDTPIHSTYVFMNGSSSIDFGTSNFDLVKRARIFFLNKILLAKLMDKLDLNKIKSFIDNDYKKKSLLK